MDCKSRCEDNRPLCTASTDNFFELDWGDPTPLLHSVFSDDPDENPAFHDFNMGRIKTIEYLLMVILSLTFSLCSILQ